MIGVTNTYNLGKGSGGGGISEEETIIDETGGVTTYRKSYVCTVKPLTYDELKFTDFNSNCYNTYLTLNQRFGVDTATNIIYRNDIIGKIGTLLWTNPSPSTTFADQTLALSSCADYDAILVNNRFHTSEASSQPLWTLGMKGVIAATYSQAVSNANAGAYRTFTMTDSGVIFGQGFGLGISYNYSGNPYALPAQIYGINLSESGKEGVNTIEHDIDAIVTNLGVKNVTNIIVVLDYTKSSS